MVLRIEFRVKPFVYGLIKKIVVVGPVDSGDKDVKIMTSNDLGSE